MKNYAIGETPSISIAAALDEAEKILKEIMMRNFKKYHNDAIQELGLVFETRKANPIKIIHIDCLALF